MQSEKENSIVIIRAVVILLVILGHSIIIYSHKWGLYDTNTTSKFFDILKDYINIVQMPIFFMISGYLLYYTFTSGKLNNLLKFLKAKFLRLIIPFFVFAFCWLLPIRMIIKYEGYNDLSIIQVLINKILLLKDVGHLWFLPALFIMFFISYFLIKMRAKIKSNIATDVFIYCFLTAVSYFSVIIANSIIRQTLYYYCFFVFGFIFNANKLLLTSIYKKLKFIIILVAILAFAISGRFSPLIWIANPFIFMVMYFEMNFENKYLTKISENSFGMYLIHSPLCYITFSLIPNINPLIVLFINFVLFGIFSYIVTFYLRKTFLRVVFGDKK